MRRAGVVPADTVVVTDLWSIAKLHRGLFGEVVTLVCDPPTRAFDLSPVHGLDVLAVHGGKVAPEWLRRVEAHTPASLLVASAAEWIVALCETLHERAALREAFGQS